MYKTKPVARAVSLALAASAFGASPQVFAQDDAGAVDDEPIEEIRVTGSRIKRDGFSSASPLDDSRRGAQGPRPA